MPKETFKIEGTGTLDISQIKSSINQIQSTFSKIKLDDNLSKSFKETFNELENQINKFNSKMEQGFQTKGDVTGLEKNVKTINSLLKQLDNNLSEVKKVNLDENIKISSKTLNALKTLDTEIENVQQSINALNASKLQQVVNALGQLKTKGAKTAGQGILEAFNSNDIEKAIQLTDELIATQQRYESQVKKSGKSTTNIEANLTALGQLKDVFDDLTSESKKFNDSIDQLNTQKTQLLSSEVTNLKTDFEQASNSAEQLGNAIRQQANASVDAANSQRILNNELDEVKGNLTNFFSLANGIDLFRDAVRSAIDTIKELDATMTEAATVTDFSVADMWDRLPSYSEEASALGAKINDLYAATTLYLQQGLEANEAQAVGIETMKMSRIASMDAAAGTDLMTAALRGFNMELNEVSAQRVNDVYSELAAVTAADTEEIGIAMSKTASIASSANMEFEVTAALLSQIIETTREAPETAGTAMKTIIARFTEVKELFDQGLLEGTDSEGQEISINKIDTALQTVGISLKDFLTGARGLDDILLELASKWDSLDLATQRYIATTAAGSRQQSRFLAMMGDYDRTMQLVDAAYNSTGASQEQFEKTLDSLESKLNQLKNAWDLFTMGIANNQLIKGAIDLLTDFINGINNLADSLGPVGGAITRVIAAFLGFQVVKNVLQNVFSGLVNTFSTSGLETRAQKAGMSVGERWRQGVENGASKLDLNKNLDEALKKINILRNTQKRLTIFGDSQHGLLDKSFNSLVDNVEGLFGPLERVDGAIASVGTSLREDLLSQLSKVRGNGESTFNGLRQSIERLGDVTSLDQLKTSLQEVQAEAKALNETMAMQNTGRAVHFSFNANSVTKINSGLKTTAKVVAQTATGITDLGSLLSAFGGTAAKVGSQITGLGIMFGDIVGIIGTVKGVLATLKVQAELTGVSLGAMLIPILGVAAALAALAGIGFAAWYFSDAQKTAREMEKLQTATEAADAAAEEATKAYEDLVSAFDSYNNAVTALDELVVGTQEWKQALMEVNQQVLSLLDSYPELAQYVTRGENGQLQISEEGQQVSTQSKLDAQNAAFSMQANTSINQLQFDYEQDVKRVQKQLDSISLGGSYDIQNLVGLYEENPNIFARREFTSSDYSSASANELVQLATQYFGKLNTGLELNQFMERDENGALRVIEGMQDELVAALSQGAPTAAAYQLEQLIGSGQAYMYSDELSTLANTYSMDINELANLEGAIAGLSSAALSTEESIEGLTNTMIGNKIDPSILEDELGQQITDIFTNVAAQDRENEIELEASELRSKFSKEELQDLYAEALEIGPEQIDESIRDNKELLSEAIAADNYSGEIASQVTEFYDNIVQKGSESAKTFLDILSQNFDDLKDIDLESLSTDEQQQKFLEKVASDLGYVTESGAADIERLASALGITIEDLASSFSDSIDIVEEQQKKTSKDLLTSMLGSGAFSNSQDMLNVLNNLSLGQKEQTVSMIDNVSPLGDQAVNTIWQVMPELSADASSFEEAQSLVNSLDFNNSIIAASQLKQGMDSADTSVAKLSQGLLEVGDSALNSGAQFQYLLSSADFTDINEQLDDFIEENGSISASNIKEVAKESDLLSSYLAQGEVDANALAKALTAIKVNNVDPSGFTDRVLEALSAVTTTDEVLSHMQETINNFSPGIDSGAGMDFLTEQHEALKEFADNYEYGNQQFQGIISQIFGSEAVATVLASEDPETAFNGYITKLGNWVQGNGYGFWNQVGLGEIVLDGVATQLDAEGNVILGQIDQKTGEFSDTVSLTTEQMLQSIMTGAGVTYDTAEMLLANFLSHSTDLAKQLGQNDFQAAVDELLTPMRNLGTEAEGVWTITQTELEAFAVSMGTTVDEVYATLQQKAAEKNGTVKVVDWFDESGAQLMGQDLVDQIYSQLDVVDGKELLMKLNVDTSQGAANVDELSAKLADLGLNEEQINSTLDTLAANAQTKLSQEVEIPVKTTLEDGSETITMDTVTVTADSVEGLDAAVNAALEAANYNLVSESIINQDFSAVGTNLEDILNTAATNAATNLGAKVNAVTFESKTISVTPVLTQSRLTVYVDEVVTSDASNAQGTGPSGFYRTGTSLVGEEGRELVQTIDGQAYLVGTQGPEIVPLQRGDIVYSNPETEKILTPKKHKTISRYATGKWNTSDKNQVWYGNSSSSGSSGSSSSSSGSGSSKTSSAAEEEEEIWENTFDWLYNLTEKISEALREQIRIERQYNKILKDRFGTSADLLQNVYDQIAALEYQAELEKEMIERRTEEMNKLMKDNLDLNKYAIYNWDAQTIEINWDEIDKVTDVDLGERIEDYISELEEIQDELDQANDSLFDIEDSLGDLEDIGKEDFFDFENRVMDALVNYYQEQIDELSLIDESINDTNSKLINSIQNSVNQMRQQRENERTEEELAEKERRLAYLRQDTSGANQLEIKQLEEELAQGQESYTDSLVDQKIQELQDQNDYAAEQRQLQIELAQAALDTAQQNGDLWKNVQELIKSGTDSLGKLITGSQLDQILKKAESWEALSNMQKMDWLKGIEQALKVSTQYYEKETDDVYGVSYDPNIDYTALILDMLASGNVDYHQLAVWEQQRNAKIINEDLDYPLRFEYIDYLDDFDPNVDYTQRIIDYLAEGDYLMAAISQYQRNRKIKELGLDYDLEYDLYPYLFLNDGNNPFLDYRDYVVDYEGYRPEGPYTLDTYSSGYNLRTSTMPTYGAETYYQNSGDNYYEVHIQVDSLSNDYDVDQLARKVEQQINENARYRNVNAINRLR